MEGQSGSDPSFTSRTSDRVGNWAMMASSEQQEHALEAAAPEGLPYGQSDPRSTVYSHDIRLHTPMAIRRSSVSSQQGVGLYYDQSGYPQAGMATYDPSRISSHISTSSAGSRSSNLEQAYSPPVGGSYYSSPLPANSQQTHLASFLYSHYQQPSLNIDTAPPGYQIMRSMSGEIAHGYAGPGTFPMSPMTSSSQQEVGVDGSNVHYQQYPSQVGQYVSSQQGFYPSAMSVPGQSGYPTMTTGMQGAYPPQQHHHHQQPQQYPPAATYGSYPTQYAVNPYANQQQPSNPYFANSRPAWSHSQQQRRQAYYSQSATLPTAPPAFRRTSRMNSTNRSKGPSTSTLPMRPGGDSISIGSSSGALNADSSIDATNSAEDSPNDDGTESKNHRRGLRPNYHSQQGPRSDHVLWCGNVPSDASVEELWNYFSLLPPDEEKDGDLDDLQIMEGQENDPAMSPHSGHGVLSIFIIARSNCAFINYASPRHLQRAVSYFHGQSLRPIDTRCPKLVCRVRKKDDEAQAGVAGQRGRGIHVAWVKEQDRKMKQKNGINSSSEGKQQQQLVETPSVSTPEHSTISSELDISSSEISTALPRTSSDPNSPTSAFDQLNVSPPDGTSKTDGKPHSSGASIDSSSGSVSYASTNSSLFRHPAFHERFFILKSLGMEDLDQSVKTGLWATQPHNEQVLDQAFRNSQTVFLIFSANQSGGFYGYAKMAGAILTTAERQQEQQFGTERGTLSSDDSPKRGSTVRPDAIPEGDKAKLDDNFQSKSAISSVFLSPENSSENSGSLFLSPLPITPSPDTDSPVSKNTSSEGSMLPENKVTNQDQIVDTSRSQTLSPHAILDKNATIIPALTTTAPSGVVISADASPSPPLSLQSRSSPNLTRVPVVMDENGVRLKDMMVESIANTNGGGRSMPTTLSSEAGSLGPADSVSYDSRQQHQLALRALIHNLRLEERDSMIRAENLEKSVDDPRSPVATNLVTPKAEHSNSFGKPFKVDWIKTLPLSFSNVRKLRNPWRDNRQIKVSRDGTELEPNTGRQLLQEWQRVEEESASLAAIPAPATFSSPTRLGDDEEEDEEL